MAQNYFPPLVLAEWQESRETLIAYAKVVGKIRRALTPPQKHWWHVSLRIAATGITTMPIPCGAKAFEILLDLVNHQVVVTTSIGEQWQTAMMGQSVSTFCAELLDALAGMGIYPEIDISQFDDARVLLYDRATVARYWQAASQIDLLLKEFQGTLREETGEVQLWPHHFDLAMLWFSGRLVPDTDPADPEYADEQMNFGFSTGDGSIQEAYFYVTAYPAPDGFSETPLPGDAYWHTEGFQAAILMYESLVGVENPGEMLLTYLRTAHQAGARLMKG